MHMSKVKSTGQRFLTWVVWDFSGARFIWEKIRPPIIRSPVNGQTTERPPATFMIWAFGIIGFYIAIFGLAFQIYEHSINIIENRANLVTTQLSLNSIKPVLSKISYIQNMACPHRPQVRRPITILKSLFGGHTLHSDMVDRLKETIIDHKYQLDCVVLKGAILNNSDLSDADFQGANLQNADLTNAHLQNSNFGVSKNYPQEIILGEDVTEIFKLRWEKYKIPGTSPKGTILDGANFQKAVLKGVDFSGVDLRQAKGLTVEQLIDVKTLYKAKLKPEIEKSLRTENPKLFQLCVQGAVIKSWSPNLKNSNLQRANFRKVKFSNVNFSGSDFLFSDFTEAILSSISFDGAILRGANFENALLPVAKIRNADLRDTNLTGANLIQADLTGSNMSGAILDGTNLRATRMKGAIGLTSDQLCRAKTLYHKIFDEFLITEVERKCPHLLEEPK